MKAVNGARFQIQWDKTFPSATAFFNFSFGNFSGFSEKNFKTQMEIMGFGNHSAAREQGRRDNEQRCIFRSWQHRDSLLIHLFRFQQQLLLVPNSSAFLGLGWVENDKYSNSL